MCVVWRHLLPNVKTLDDRLGVRGCDEGEKCVCVLVRGLEFGFAVLV